MDRVLGIRLAVARSDLFNKDVCLPSVPCNIANHAQVDEPQVHRADQPVFGGVVQAVVRSDFPDFSQAATYSAMTPARVSAAVT
jgi:hypothetical protein